MLIGQGEDYGRRLEQAARLSLHHGLLISGGRGMGKSSAARAFASALLCGEESGSAACAAQVEAGQHPDLHRLTVPEDKVDIPIEAVRALQHSLALKPVAGRARVAIIDPADRLNEQGQNALLKTLEEPGPATFLILVTSRPESLLETVRSRVDRLGLRPVPREKILDFLGQQPLLEPESLNWAATAAAGSMGRAQTLASERALELDREIAQFLGSPGPGGDLASSLLAGVKGRRESEERLDLVLFLLRSRLRSQLQVALANGDRDPYLEMWKDRWGLALEQLLQAEDDLALKIGAAQVLGDLFRKLGSSLTGSGPLG
ncbi:MAG: AAA family ATPase [Planctomycetota bacterium]|jgi:DNA polymerase-3 subunit delta'